MGRCLKGGHSSALWSPILWIGSTAQDRVCLLFPASGSLVYSFHLSWCLPPHLSHTYGQWAHLVLQTHVSSPGICCAKSLGSSAVASTPHPYPMPSSPRCPLWAASTLPGLWSPEFWLPWGGEHAGRKGLSLERWEPAHACLLARPGAWDTQEQTWRSREPR